MMAIFFLKSGSGGQFGDFVVLHMCTLGSYPQMEPRQVSWIRCVVQEAQSFELGLFNNLGGDTPKITKFGWLMQCSFYANFPIKMAMFLGKE